MSQIEFPLSLTPSLPTYPQVRAFLKVVQGVAYATYRSMVDAIQEQKGTPQENVDWSNPEEWIPGRLTGADWELALKIWRETHELVNPRHTRGCWYLVSKHDLIARDSEDHFEITSTGMEFLDTAEGESTAHVDQAEGLLNVLQVISEHTPGRRGDILPGYVDFCNTYTTYRAVGVHKSSLYERFVNLIDRGLITRSGLFYEITPKGIERLQKYPELIIGRTITLPQSKLQELGRTINKEARKKLAELLAKMNPFKFEYLIKLLLEEMGYNNVQVTTPSNDGGVDVVADIEVGISSIHEVVQVKRRAGTINRPVLDQLRGVLFHFKALRGTIITTGKFAAGAKKASLEQGGSPITLIDGEKLLDLMMQYEIGLSKKAVEFYEFDDSKLLQFADQPPILVEQENG